MQNVNLWISSPLQPVDGSIVVIMRLLSDCKLPNTWIMAFNLYISALKVLHARRRLFSDVCLSVHFMQRQFPNNCLFRPANQYLSSALVMVTWLLTQHERQVKSQQQQHPCIQGKLLPSQKNQSLTESLQSVGSRSLFNPEHIDLYGAVIASVCPGLFPPVIEAWQRSLS